MPPRNFNSVAEWQAAGTRGLIARSANAKIKAARRQMLKDDGIRQTRENMYRLAELRGAAEAAEGRVRSIVAQHARAEADVAAVRETTLETGKLNPDLSSMVFNLGEFAPLIAAAKAKAEEARAKHTAEVERQAAEAAHDVEPVEGDQAPEGETVEVETPRRRGRPSKAGGMA